MVRMRVRIKVGVNVRVRDFRRAWQQNNGKSVPCLTKLVLIFFNYTDHTLLFQS